MANYMFLHFQNFEELRGGISHELGKWGRWEVDSTIGGMQLNCRSGAGGLKKMRMFKKTHMALEACDYELEEKAKEVAN
ncbi:unnamed protein product [Dovyalis caffra]|uniref:Uncharacterized protein n=1 Tax=Dovyalis caffra TaxID=77055 RepID=A0AAV1R1W8_9ROSI|nr:unnamed protein product [Dovyalis caffra]